MTNQEILALVAVAVILVLYYFLIVRRSAKKQYQYVKTLKVGDEVLYDGRKCKILRLDDDGCPIIEIRANKLKFDSRYNFNWK